VSGRGKRRQLSAEGRRRGLGGVGGRGVRERLREAERALAAAVRLLEILLAEEGRVETVVGLLSAAVGVGRLGSRQGAALLRVLRQAGWRFEREIDLAKLAAELAAENGHREEEPS